MERSGRTLFRGLWVLILGGTLLVPASLPAQVQHQHRGAAWKQVTRASWYGGEFRGQRTAGGTRFNPQRLTAAHRTLHIGSKVKVTELRSGRSVVVQITDRGPFSAGRGIDLSYAAARELGIIRRGVAQVRLELVEKSAPATDAPVVTASSWPNSTWLPKAIVE